MSKCWILCNNRYLALAYCFPSYTDDGDRLDGVKGWVLLERTAIENNSDAIEADNEKLNEAAKKQEYCG